MKEDLSQIWAQLFVAGFQAKPGVLRRDKKVQPPKAEPYGRSYDEVLAIRQSGARGFQTIDIDPNLLDRVNFYPLIPENILNQFVGSEIGQVATGFKTESDHLPFWRTVEIPGYATWLKVEYLPSGMNDNSTYRENFPDETQYPTFVVPGSGTQTADPNFIVKHLSERIIFLQFEDPKQAPLIAKSGNVYRIPFNSAFLTFKVWSPKIRVTLGFNTDIIESDDRVLNCNPAYAPGHGLLNSPFLHAVPFCLSTQDTGAAGGTVITTNAAPSVTEDMIANPVDNTFNQNGLFVGWITSFNHVARLTNPAVEGRGLAAIFVATYPGLVPIRKLCEIPFLIEKNVNQGVAVISQNLPIIEPVRFTLHRNEALICVLTGDGMNDPTASIFHRFSLSGYTYGNLYSSTGFMPFVPQYKLTQEPYPQDRNYTGAPLK